MPYNNITLIPAYGRDYKSKAAVLADWNAGKDFTFPEGRPYVSKAEANLLRAEGNTHIHFRYRKLEQICVLAL